MLRFNAGASYGLRQKKREEQDRRAEALARLSEEKDIVESLDPIIQVCLL